MLGSDFSSEVDGLFVKISLGSIDQSLPFLVEKLTLCQAFHDGFINRSIHVLLLLGVSFLFIHYSPTFAKNSL
jgi:hypothetical protein